MSVSEETIDQLGNKLFHAWKDAVAIDPITETYPEMTIDEAYKIQLQYLRQRTAYKGEHHTGKKIGLTAAIVQKQLGVDQPDFGHLLSGMAYSDRATLDCKRFIKPRVEGEIAFILKHDLSGSGITAADVLEATDMIVPCFEIVDSRITDWRIKVQDTIADNGSSGAYVVGAMGTDPRNIDLYTVGMFLEKNGEIVGTGAGAASLGNPVTAVAWLANSLGKYGISLKAGEIILSGSLSVVVDARPGDFFHLDMGKIGTANVRFE